LLTKLEDKGYLITLNESNTKKKYSVEKYIVKKSDTIESIAFKYGVDWKKIAEINDLEIISMPSGIKTANIHRGQQLEIEK